MKENVALQKSFSFAERIYRLHKFLLAEKKEYVLARQILRSGTSIGANMEEAVAAQSKRDFVAKVSIAYREARETSYWLRLLCKVSVIEEIHFESIHKDCTELMNLLSSILVTTKNKMKAEEKLKIKH
jgi:four helix bundle protein